MQGSLIGNSKLINYWNESECYGQKLTRTRRINKLAKEGVRFTQCYAGGHQNQTGRNVHGRSDDAEDLRLHQP